MDNFAQTGAQQEDLFDDVVYTNGEESMQTRGTEDLFFGDDFTPAEEPTVQEALVQPVVQSTRGRGGRGRGARGRDRQRNQNGPRGPAPAPVPTAAIEAPKVDTPTQAIPIGLLSSRHAPQPHEQPHPRPQPRQQAKPQPKVETPAPTEPLQQTQEQPQPQSQPQTQVESQAPTTEQTPDLEQTSAQPQSAARSLAVRGDRSATGGNARKKLTETELAEKMSRIQLKNADLEAAHARAQADAESFAKNEAEAAKRRQEERRDRQQMMGEREKNRLRKLKAQEGREWDSEKVEETAGRGYGRGANGGVVGRQEERGVGGDVQGWDDGREYIYRENRGRGRGGANVRGRGGRGRGGADAGDRQSLPQKDDFPELPAAPKKEATNGEAQATDAAQSNGEKQALEGAKPVPVKTESLEIKEGQKWSDMVEE